MRIHSYNHQTLCRDATRIACPTTVDEARDAVLDAWSRTERLRAVGARHSTNSQICSDGAVVLTERLRRIVGLEDFHGEQTVVVEAGVELGQLVDWLDEHGKALGFAFPNFRRVSIAGAVSTGAHGSSWVHDAIISSLVRELVVLMPDGTVCAYDGTSTSPDLWKALKVGLGALGMIVQVRLRVVDQFNVTIETTFVDEDAVLDASGAVTWLEPCDYDQYVWFPSARRIMRVGGRISNDAATHGVRNKLLIEEMSWPSFKAHGWILGVGRRSSLVNGMFERRRVANFAKHPPFEVKDGKGRWRASTCVVGPSHLMLVSDLPTRERYYRMSNWEFAVPIEHAAAALAFMRTCFREHRVALPLFGVVLRFAPCRDDTWIGHTVAHGAFRTVAVLVDYLVYESAGGPANPQPGRDDVWTVIAKELMAQFGARPHWGKNHDWAFAFAMEHSVYGPNVARFIEQVHAIDPRGAFSNRFCGALFRGPTRS